LGCHLGCVGCPLSVVCCFIKMVPIEKSTK
jgi:hypothetical protein